MPGDLQIFFLVQEGKILSCLEYFKDLCRNVLHTKSINVKELICVFWVQYHYWFNVF